MASTASRMDAIPNDVIKVSGPSESSSEDMSQQMLSFTSRTSPDTYVQVSKHSVQPLTCSGKGVYMDNQSCCHSIYSKEINEASSCKNTPPKSSLLQGDQRAKLQHEEIGRKHTVDAIRAKGHDCDVCQTSSGVHESCLNLNNDSRETVEVMDEIEPIKKDEDYTPYNDFASAKRQATRPKKANSGNSKVDIDWDSLRKKSCPNGTKVERSSDTMDLVDWDAVRCAVRSAFPNTFETAQTHVGKQKVVLQLEGSLVSRQATACEPIIEEPSSPEPEPVEDSIREIEEDFVEDPDEIPHIKLNLEAFTQNIQDFMQSNKKGHEGEMSNALVVLTQEAASIPVPKLKNRKRLRTEHLVYELTDNHPLLEGFNQREPDDPSPYLLAIWSPGETAHSYDQTERRCNSRGTGELCDIITCFACNSVREARTQTVRGTIMIPCRTANKGSFPLNGTYFQVNEVFADHESSLHPIVVPRHWIGSLPRRTVYFGTSVPAIFKGLTTDEIMFCFWKGFVCVRGFDRETGAPRPLYARLHLAASKAKNMKAAEEAAAAAVAAAEAEEARKQKQEEAKKQKQKQQQRHRSRNQM